MCSGADRSSRSAPRLSGPSWILACVVPSTQLHRSARTRYFSAATTPTSNSPGAVQPGHDTRSRDVESTFASIHLHQKHQTKQQQQRTASAEQRSEQQATASDRDDNATASSMPIITPVRAALGNALRARLPRPSFQKGALFSERAHAVSCSETTRPQQTMMSAQPTRHLHSRFSAPRRAPPRAGSQGYALRLPKVVPSRPSTDRWSGPSGGTSAPAVTPRAQDN